MELWPGEMAVTYHTSDLELLSHPTRQIYEYKVRDKDGVEHPAIFAKNVFRDEHNQVAGIVGAFLDITERKRAEETLFRQTEMLQLVLDNIPAGVFWKGRNLIYMGCNSACARAAGLGAPGEIIGKSDFDLAWKASAEAYRTDDRAVMEGNTAKIDFEEALPLPDGSIGTIITNKVPLHDREGNVLGMMGTFEDITLRKRAGEEAARMVTVLRDSNDAITIQDFEGRITAWNRGAELMYGYGEAEALAMSIERLTAPGKVDEQKAFVRRLVADEAITSQETQRVTKDGRVLDVWMTVTKLVDKTGKPIGIASTERDTTALRKAEEALRKLNAELEQRVEQRTRELVLANDAAKAANRAKSDFLASMSHELRTPLNAIIGFSEILEDCTFGDLNAKQTRHVGNVLTAGRHLLSLINDILDLSKVEAGKMELELSAVPVKALLEEALVMVREKALQHRLDLTLAAPDDVVVTADERKLKQILFNLLSNAMKFTPDGGRVTVSARVCEQLPVISDPSSVTSSPPPSTLTLVVAVSDSGIGIGPEDRARLFQPFLQLDSSSTRKQEGTGLGLALARRFVELHGGRIWVESEGEGRGSTFSFAIPLAPGAPPEPALERFEWTAQLSVEVSVLDAQHRRLCGMLNTLVLGRDSGAAEELVLRILAELVSYAVEHFHDEEALMSQHGYPRLDEHVRQHLAFAARIAELTAASGGGGQGVRGDLVAYLRDWITHHILGEDMRYKPFFAARGVS
jgi:hemerythrin-like metal-binding protein/PAS domain S-box-containing protein